jgi:hypothetical protein
MAINFPTTGLTPNVTTYSLGDRTWLWSGTAWQLQNSNISGYTGSAGVNGYTGSQGYTGSKGNLGYTGSAGVDGYTGSKGDIGYTGSTGYTGSQGVGFTGSAGTNGSTGYTGSQGNIGYTGSVGPANTGPAFSAYANNTTQTITSGSQQKVLFQTEEFDTNNNFVSSRFTPTVAGYYQLNAEVRLNEASGTGEMMIVIWKNGAEYRRGINQSGTQIASNFWAMQVSSLVYANGSTDYFEIYVQQGSGVNVTVTAVNSANITWFNGCMIRGA